MSRQYDKLVTELPGINAQERTRGKLLETLTELLQEEIESNRCASRKYALTLSEEVAISISD